MNGLLANLFDISAAGWTQLAGEGKMSRGQHFFQIAFLISFRHPPLIRSSWFLLMP